MLALSPQKAVVNDFNPELINAWKVIRDNPQGLITKLDDHKKLNTKEYYLQLRLADRDGRLEEMTETERAARFIYMNKVGFNGLWRVNKQGQNNVPYGSYKQPKIFDKAVIRNVASFLNEKQIELISGDFAKSVENAQTGDFVYFDPPYLPLSDTANFTAYSASFDIDEQIRLRDLFIELRDRGVFVLLSNHDTPLIYELYQDAGEIIKVSVARSVAAKATSRKNAPEVIIKSW